MQKITTCTNNGLCSKVYYEILNMMQGGPKRSVF